MVRALLRAAASRRRGATGAGDSRRADTRDGVSPAARGHHARWHRCLIGCDVYHRVLPVKPAAAARGKPAISSLRVSPKSFSLAGRRVNGQCVKPTRQNNGNKHCRRPTTLRISYTLNVAATVTLTLKRRVAGRKVNGGCVKPTTKNRKHRKCTRLVNVPGALTLAGQAGANQSTFNGKIGGRQLGSGAYQLIATPAGGTRARSRSRSRPDRVFPLPERRCQRRPRAYPVRGAATALLSA